LHEIQLAAQDFFLEFHHIAARLQQRHACLHTFFN
jgi:hypothetical protein